MELENREIACLVWNTMYPDRKPFEDIDESAKYEWTKFVKTTKKVLELNNMDSKFLKEVKSKLKT